MDSRAKDILHNVDKASTDVSEANVSLILAKEYTALQMDLVQAMQRSITEPATRGGLIGLIRRMRKAIDLTGEEED